MSRPRILLVDDNAALLTLLSRLVEAEGWEPVAAPRGRQALELIASGPVAAAAVDVLLPDIMGYEVGAALRHLGIPFVFMTGIFKGGRAAEEGQQKHGAAGYFEKPFPGKKLVDALRALVEAAPRAAPAQARAPAPVDSDDFDVDVAVEDDQPTDALDLTGRVTVTEDGRVSAILRGEAVWAPAGRPTRAPAAEPPGPPPTAAQVHAEAQARRAATPSAPPVPTKEGQLEENLPELITAFWLAQQTGELTLQRGKVKKTLYFDAGRPCFAISNLVTDRFGPFLHRIGKIDAAQLGKVQADAEKTRRRTGDILVEMGFIKETEKLYYVAQQVKAIVYSLFGWEEGEYRLHMADRASREALKLDLHPAQIILRGVKKLYKPERLFRLLSPEDRLVPTPQPAFGLHEVELERWEAELLSRIDGTKTLAELIRMANRPEHQVYGSLYGLTALKILDRR